MRTLVLYSSRTGNTEKVAQAIASALPAGTPCLPVGQAPADLTAYDLVFLGYWVDRGTANAEARAVMEGLHNEHIALFATLGADPQSEHGKMCLEHGAALLPDPDAVIEMMYKQFPAGHPHGKSPARDALHARAAVHPDEQDLRNAAAFAASVLKRLEGKG